MAKKAAKRTPAKKQNLPPLDNVRLSWLFAAAQDHYAEEVGRLEVELIRHTEMLKLESPVYFAKIARGPQFRRDKLQNIERYLNEYRQIIEYCEAARYMLDNASSKDFAKDIGAFLRGKK